MTILIDLIKSGFTDTEAKEGKNEIWANGNLRIIYLRTADVLERAYEVTETKVIKISNPYSLITE